jgi:hypothetical protein
MRMRVRSEVMPMPASGFVGDPALIARSIRRPAESGSRA